MKNKKVVAEEVKDEVVAEEVKDEATEEIKDDVVEVIEEVKKESWFSKTKKWFSNHKNEVIAFAAGAATGTGLTAMIIAGQIKEELDSNDEIIEVVEEEVEVEE